MHQIERARLEREKLPPEMAPLNVPSFATSTIKEPDTLLMLPVALTSIAFAVGWTPTADNGPFIVKLPLTPDYLVSPETPAIRNEASR